MHILITGGLGFQGCKLSRQLANNGNYVRILNTFSEESLKNWKHNKLFDCEIIWGSVTDKNILDKTVRDVDLVFHLASNIHVDDSIKNPLKYYEVNVIGTNNILEFCRERNIPMVYVSSCEVFGSQNDILTEFSSLKPNSPYASSKAGADVMCYSYYKTYDMQINILRPSNIFGPGQKNGIGGAVIPRFVNKILKNEDITVYGKGSQMREFTFIDDLIDAYNLIVEKTLFDRNFKGNTFNIGSGYTISILDLAQLIIKLTSSDSKIIHLEERSGEVKKFEIDSSLFKNYFNWNAKTNIEEGIKKYVNWIKHVA